MRYGRWRQPFNHVTLIPREVYNKAGGYQPDSRSRRLDMFHRMIMSGVRFMNLTVYIGPCSLRRRNV